MPAETVKCPRCGESPRPGRNWQLVDREWRHRHDLWVTASDDYKHGDPKDIYSTIAFPAHGKAWVVLDKAGRLRVGINSRQPALIEDEELARYIFHPASGERLVRVEYEVRELKDSE
jgi:hypothetical protein